MMKIQFLHLFPLLLAQMFFGGSEKPLSTEQVAVYSKPSVVRVFSACSGVYEVYSSKGKEYEDEFYKGAWGTGFFINSEGYILTTAHVVEVHQEGRNDCKRRLLDEASREVSSRGRGLYIKPSDEPKSFAYFHHVLLPNSKQNSAEALPFDIKEIGNTDPGTGKDVAIIKVQLSNTPVLSIGNSDNVSLGDQVTVIGYPASGDRFDEFGDNSLVESGVYTGSVSKVNSRLKDNSEVLALDVSVAYGSSGSPVIDEQGNVIGMVTFNESEARSQANLGSASPLAIKTDGLLEYVRQGGISNEKSKLDILYQEGLDFFWRGDPEGAKKKFEAVRDLFPQHSETDRLLQKVRDAIATGESTGKDYTPWVLGVLAIGGMLASAYWLISRRSSESEPVPATGYSGTDHSNFGSSPSPAPSPAIKQLPSEPQKNLLPIGIENRDVRQTTVYTTEPYIELRNQSDQKHYLYLQEDVHTIGRDSTWSDIKDIPDEGWPVISRKQATLYRDGNTYRIYDGDQENDIPSRNGIFINGQIIEKDGHVLKNGDRLTIGSNPQTQVFLTYYNPF